MFPAGFSHVASGYGAGYYGYCGARSWPPICAPRSAPTSSSAAVGQRYRDTVLANGGQRPPQALVREFLGRDSNSQAFLKDLLR